MLDHVLQFKREAIKVSNKNFGYNLYILAHKVPGSDSYVVLKNLLKCRTFVGFIKNGAGIVSPNVFNGYVDRNKKIPQ